MAFNPRLLAAAPLALTLLTAGGCSGGLLCSDSVAERGHADASVEVVDVSGPVGMTATVEEWRLEPHPQTPDEPDMVFYAYRLVRERDLGSNVDLDVCAVDADRVALACGTIASSMAWEQEDGSLTGEDWLTVEHPERVAAVLLVPNDQSGQGPDCDADPKDGGGTHPPEPASVGDRL